MMHAGRHPTPGLILCHGNHKDIQDEIMDTIHLIIMYNAQ